MQGVRLNYKLGITCGHYGLKPMKTTGFAQGEAHDQPQNVPSRTLASERMKFVV